MSADRPALLAGMTAHKYTGLCIGGPLDGQMLTSRSRWHCEIIRIPLPLGPFRANVAKTAPMPDHVEYRHLYQPWGGPKGEYRDFWVWLADGICERAARETLERLFPDGPPPGMTARRR
jgi:hypothetical protein